MHALLTPVHWLNGDNLLSVRSTYKKLEYGPMHNVMAVLPKVAPSVQRRKVWLTPTTRVSCIAAKTRNPLKFVRVSQTNETISAASGPQFTTWRRYCCLASFFPIVDTCLSCEDIARQSCGMVPTWRLLAIFCVLYFGELRAARFRPAF